MLTSGGARAADRRAACPRSDRWGSTAGIWWQTTPAGWCRRRPGRVRRSGHGRRDRCVFRLSGLWPAGPVTVRRRRRAPRPGPACSAVDLGCVELARRLERRQLGPMQCLVGVSVSDPGEHGLVGEHRLDVSGLTRQERLEGRPLRSRARAGSGPSRATPSMSARSATTHSARRFSVPCSVTSKPPPPDSPTRSASGPLPGRARAGGVTSRHWTQPPRARCMTSHSVPACRPTYFPRRAAPATSWPRSDSIGGA